MTNPQILIDGDMVERLIAEMAENGTDGGTGVSRTVYSPEWVSALEMFRSWCIDSGLETRVDEVGNIWASVPGTEPGPITVTGSHVDTQVPGGRYDGTLGWIAAFVAVRALVQQHGQPKLPIEIVGFCEEEGSRFPANFWGSRAITAAISSNEASEIIGLDGMSIGAAMQDVGLDPNAVAQAARDDIDTFVELHIEQGPILEAEDLPVAVVTAITGMRHYLVKLQGVANHAGAFPMDLRRDPVLGMADIIRQVRDAAAQMGRPAVTTVGRINVNPNGGAIIADSVEFVVDVRHPDEAAFTELCAKHERTMQQVAASHGLDVSWSIISDHAPTQCDPQTVQDLSATAESLHLPYKLMHSGAGHDTMQMAEVAKVAMIFVRSKDGRSHTPEEFSSIEDVVAGIELLAHYLYRRCY